MRPRPGGLLPSFPLPRWTPPARLLRRPHPALVRALELVESRQVSLADQGAPTPSLFRLRSRFLRDDTVAYALRRALQLGLVRDPLLVGQALDALRMTEPRAWLETQRWTRTRRIQQRVGHQLILSPAGARLLAEQREVHGG